MHVPALVLNKYCFSLKEIYGTFKACRRVHTIFGFKIHFGAGSQGNTTIIRIGLLGTHSRSDSRLLLKLLMLKFLMLEAFLKEIESFLKERKWISCARRILEGLDKAGECLCGIAEEVSTCDALAFREHVGNAGLNIPCRDFRGVRLQEGVIAGRRRESRDQAVCKNKRDRKRSRSDVICREGNA